MWRRDKRGLNLLFGDTVNVSTSEASNYLSKLDYKEEV
jgi:hypothetical protein